MTSLLLDHLRSVFTATATGELAKTTGEIPAATQKAMDALLPVISTGITNYGQTSQGAATLVRLLTSTSFATDPSVGQLVDTDAHRITAAKSGNDLLGRLFPDRPERLAESVASYSGVGSASARTITGLVMSVLMGFLHKQVKNRSLTEGQLATLLRGETDTLRGLVPVALLGSLGWFLGTDARPTPVRTETVAQPTQDRAGVTPWWRWLLYILIPLLLLFLLLRTCKSKEPQQQAGTVTPMVTDTVTTDTVASDLDGNEASAGPAVRVGVDLPGGRKLNIVENSFNYSLAQFLATKGGKVPKVFTFDNLTFESNSARITEQARPNVDDLLQIMQAYPTLQIRIEGNTDSTGDDAINDPLSGERAEAVKQALIKGGIAASRVTTRERGDTKPVATNETEAGRQKNRRIDVVVTHT